MLPKHIEDQKPLTSGYFYRLQSSFVNSRALKSLVLLFSRLSYASSGG